MQFLTVLAGANFRPAPTREVLKQVALLSQRPTLRLEREPSNAYDPNAIKVILTVQIPVDDQLTVADEDYFIGYVAGADAKMIAPYLDNTAPSEEVAPGHTPTVERCEVLDFTSGPLKPTIIIEISTGYEVGTVVRAPDAADDDDLDPEYYPDEDEPGSD